MDGNIFAPGPTPSTVRAADGTVLTAPVGDDCPLQRALAADG
jgi:hypothetical protein